jgi:hypothetical protein
LTYLAHGAAAPTPPAQPRKAQADGVPAAWAGRWLAQPFAGAAEIEVRHRQAGTGVPRVYLIKDRQTVTAVVRAARITGIRNGVYSGCLPTAELVVRRGDGSTFEASLGSDTCLSSNFGLFNLDEGFFTALGRAAAGPGKPPIDLRKFLPAPPGAFVKPVPATAKSLASGFTSLEVTYLVGERLHSTRIADRKALDSLHKALTVLGTARLSSERAESRNMWLNCKDGARFYLHIQDKRTIFDFNVGKFTLAPAFIDALNREVSRRAGFPIDVAADRNALPEAAGVRARRFRELLAQVRALRCRMKRGDKVETIVVEGREAVEMVKQLRWVEGAPRDLKLPRWDRSIQFTTRAGRTLTLSWLNPGRESHAALESSAMPNLSDLVEVPGVGQVWIDNQWWGRFSDLAYKRELEAKGRRDAETARLVCRDLPAFWKLVIGGGTHYSSGADQLSDGLTPEQARAVVRLLSAGQFRRLDWSEKRWQKEIADLVDRGAGEVELAPGLGFSLPVLVSGE